MKDRAHGAVLVAVLLSLPALTTACGTAGRDGAASDQAALHKALSSVPAPRGLTLSMAAAKNCAELSSDCPDVGSMLKYAVDRGNLKPCTAVVALQSSIPAVSVRWRGAAPDGKPAAEVTAVRPNPAVLMAACTQTMSARRMFRMTSELDQPVVQAKWGKAVLMVMGPGPDPGRNPADLDVTLMYDGPAAYALTQ